MLQVSFLVSLVMLTVVASVGTVIKPAIATRLCPTGRVYCPYGARRCEKVHGCFVCVCINNIKKHLWCPEPHCLFESAVHCDQMLLKDRNNCAMCECRSWCPVGDCPPPCYKEHKNNGCGYCMCPSFSKPMPRFQRRPK